MILSDVLELMVVISVCVGGIGGVIIIWRVGPDIFSKFTPLKIRMLFWICIVLTIVGDLAFIFMPALK